MTTDTAARLALALYVLGVISAFVGRTWLHLRRTGSTGYQGLSGPVGSAQWWGGVLFGAAVVLGAAGPALAAAGLGPHAVELSAVLHWVGLVAAVLGSVVVLVAQSAMGSAWRIGVDPGERTSLVTAGAFALVRNPVFTAMVAALAGMSLLVPTAVTIAALACLVLAIELQVRLVEEPYLRAVHGEHYAHYAARVGRFLPGVGLRRQPATTREGPAR